TEDELLTLITEITVPIPEVPVASAGAAREGAVTPGSRSPQPAIIGGAVTLLVGLVAVLLLPAVGAVLLVVGIVAIGYGLAKRPKGQLVGQSHPAADPYDMQQAARQA